MPPLLTVSVNYTPRLTKAEQQLLSLGDRLRNLSTLMTQVIAPEADAMLSRHWDSKGQAFGHPWAPWKQSTFRARVRKGNVGKGVLDDSGALKSDLFASIRSGNRLQTINGGLRLSLAPDDPTERRKFGFLLRGTRFMVARQPVPSPLPRSFRDRVRALTRDFLLTGRARGAGGQFVGTSVGAPS
jgi:hypothetical protein